MTPTGTETKLSERQVAAFLRRSHERDPDAPFAAKVPEGVTYNRARHIAIKHDLAGMLRINRPRRSVRRPSA